MKNKKISLAEILIVAKDLHDLSSNVDRDKIEQVFADFEISDIKARCDVLEVYVGKTNREKALLKANCKEAYYVNLLDAVCALKNYKPPRIKKGRDT